MFYNYLKKLLGLLLFFLVRVEIRGLNNLPKEGPVVLVSNHVSNWDPVILGVFLPRKLVFMAKEELFEIFLIGYIVRKVEAIPVKRGKSDRTAIRECTKVLQEGKVLCVFPEGTRSKTGEIQKFQPGATLLAYKGQAQIIPIGLKNTGQIIKGILPTIIINIGEGINISDNGGDKVTGEMLEEITVALQNKVRDLVE